MLKSSKGLNLSINEIHLLQTVCEAAPNCTISRLSADQRVSLPSVTAAVNKLARKGYVEKQKSAADGRVVYVVLTKAGRRATVAHRYFHMRMVRSITDSLSTDEQEIMLKGFQKLNRFFESRLHRKEEET